MIKIPDDNKRFIQSNKSDRFGNIWYTKNINFDDEGYLKLSKRAISIYNSDDDTNFNNPVSFGRTSFGDFNVTTVEKEFILSLGNSLCSISADGGAGVPSLDLETYGVWFNNKWNVTNGTKLYYKTESTGAWTDSGVSLTDNVLHPICSFERKGAILVGNGNEVKQLAADYSMNIPGGGTYAQLTLSTDYEVNGIAYNNNLAGITTKLSTTVEGKDKEAQFFVWDGLISSANYAYGVGSDACIAITPYKSSFVILTRNGQLKYFNGGGFDDLASFPVYFKDIVWVDFVNGVGYGDMMKVEGDNIYININNRVLTNKLEVYEESFIAGIWCYDPSIGLYHRYSPSISKGYVLACREADVNISTNTITKYDAFSMPSSPTIPATGNPIKVMDTSIGGLTKGQVYYIIKVSTTEFQLAETKDKALAGIAVDLTSAASGYFLTYSIQDYSQSLTTTYCGGLTITGYKAFTYDNIIFGGRYLDNNSGSSINHLITMVSDFRNIGYFTTIKELSTQTEDNYQKLFIKYKPLGDDDKIIIKYKEKEIYGLPEYPSDSLTTVRAAVLSPKIISISGYIPKSYEYINASTENELECEIISGSGSGQMSKVSSITFEDNVYSIELEDTIDGWAAGDTCEIKLDNWKYLDTVISTDGNGWKEIPIVTSSKWLKLKVVLDGSDIAIEELKVINKTHLPSE